MAFAPADIVIYNDNSQTITVAVSQTLSPTTPVNDATVTATLKARDGTVLLTTTLTYTPLSAGLYTLDIPANFHYNARSSYSMYINVVSPTVVTSNFHKRVSIRERT